jgi:hypothetical protein
MRAVLLREKALYYKDIAKVKDIKIMGNSAEKWRG